MPTPFTDIVERGLETLIKTYLTEQNGYGRWQAAQSDAESCVDAELLASFLTQTQTKATDKLMGVYGSGFSTISPRKYTTCALAVQYGLFARLNNSVT